MQARIENYLGRRVHFLGIGGSSMSGLAGLLQQNGYTVTGTDLTKSHKTDALVKKGILIFIGHQPENIHGADLIVYSAAIGPENCERREATALGIPQIERSELIGQLMEGKKFAVGVSGTHGKTTVTSMIAQIFMAAGVDPTIHIGGELDFIGGSTRSGSGEDFICEACEFHNTFLQFHPTVAVILNIDEDHLDFFKDIDHIEASFAAFAARVPQNGHIIGWGDDMRVRRVMEHAGRSYIAYGLSAQNAFRPANLTYNAQGCASYDAALNGEILCHVDLSISGEANMLDSLAALACAHLRGLDMDRAAEMLSAFIGAHRRYELTSITDGVSLYTDYGHNPAEIKNALTIASLTPHRALWAVWQPHTYSRTKSLFQGFVETFDKADHLLITDIMAAREVDPGDIHATMLVDPIRARGIDVHYTATFDDAETYLRANWHPGDIVVTHGCGNIDLLNEQISLHGDTLKEDGE